MSFPARLTYISGFCYYAYTALLVFFGPLIPIVMLAFLPGDVQLRNFIILVPSMLTGFVLYPFWHRSRYGPSTLSLGVARGWAHVFAIWDGALGKNMSWHPSRTPGSSLPRFRFGVTWWSGGAAALWLMLAVWRTWSAGSVRFAVLLVFGVLNARSRRPCPVRRRQQPMKSRLVMLMSLAIAALSIVLAANNFSYRLTPAPAVHAKLPSKRRAPSWASTNPRQPSSYAPIEAFGQVAGRKPNLAGLHQWLGRAVRRRVRRDAARPRRYAAHPD